MSQSDENAFVSKLKKFGKAAWAYIKHARIELIVIVGIIALDLITKALAARFLKEVIGGVPIIPKFLNLTYLENTKAAFGSAFGLEKVLGDEAIRIIFLVITLIAMCVFSYILYRCRKRHFLMRLSIAMILAGAFGNFVDRAALHYVRDFIEFEYFGLTIFGSTSFPVFNVADIALSVGVVIFLIYFIIIYKEPKKTPVTQTKTEINGSAAIEDSTVEDAEPASTDISAQDNSEADASESIEETTAQEKKDNDSE